MKNLLILILALALGAVLARADSSITVPAGKSVTISVNVAGGTQPLKYEWYKTPANGGADVKLPYATASFEITAITQADAGVYRAIVMNSAGQTQSDRATAIVGPPPVIVTPPSGATISISVIVSTSTP